MGNATNMWVKKCSRAWMLFLAMPMTLCCSQFVEPRLEEDPVAAAGYKIDQTKTESNGTGHLFQTSISSDNLPHGAGLVGGGFPKTKTNDELGKRTLQGKERKKRKSSFGNRVGKNKKAKEQDDAPQAVDDNSGVAVVGGNDQNDRSSKATKESRTQLMQKTPNQTEKKLHYW